MKKNNITVVLPIHKYNKDIANYLKTALSSIYKQVGQYAGLVIVGSDKVLEQVKTEFDKDLKDNLGESYQYLVNTKTIDFQTQINFAVDNIKTEWFTILEFDDELNDKFFFNGERYINKMGSDVKVFLPILVETNTEDRMIKFTNQIIWSKSFVGENKEVGYLNEDALNEYTDFKISSGAFINREMFQSVGGLKKNIELTFTYEFLLRVLKYGNKVYNIPKIGVKHLIDREDSLFSNYAVKLNMDERKFWFETAKKESNFSKDRKIDVSTLKK